MTKRGVFTFVCFGPSKHKVTMTEEEVRGKDIPLCPECSMPMQVKSIVLKEIRP